MEMKRNGILCLALAAVFAAGPAAALTQTVTVNFDSQPDAGFTGVPLASIPTISPHVSFSTDPGSTLMLFGGAGFVGGSPPNILTGVKDATPAIFDANVYVDFAEPVQNLSFKVAADNDAGVIAALRVFVNGGLADVSDIVGNGSISDAIPIDLSSFADITRLEIVGISDEFGLGYDDFRFDVPAIPEPTAAWMFTAGLLALGAARFRWR